MTQRRLRDPSERIARRLVAEGRISRELHDAAMRQRQETGQRFEEALLEVGLGEEQLLPMLAETYRVQYVSTAKLSAAAIDKRTLAMVPVQIAEHRQVVPVLLDRQRSVLSIVTADPDDLETLKELEIATQVRTIRVLVARPAAVHAAIRKFYMGDDFAFTILKNASFDVARGLMRDLGTAPYQEPTLSERGLTVPRDPAAASLAPPPSASQAPTSASRRSREPGSPGIVPPPVAEAPPAAPAPRGSLTPPVPPARNRDNTPGKRAVTLAPEQLRSEPPESLPNHEVQPEPDSPPVASAIGDPFQLAVVMVSLLEGNRRDLRGHSLQTARLVRSVCEHLALSPERTQAAEIAALIHDFGKASSYHLTPYNVARFDGHHAVAQKLHATPARVVETAELATLARKAVTHMYERYDGSGFPAGWKASAIPLESRILSICDSYTDLTSNPRNSFRRVLTAKEACEALRELIGTVFDPRVLDRFVHTVLGDDIAQRLTGDRGTILVVDSDVEETTVLELALLENLYRVQVVRATDEALRFAEGSDVDVVVSEMKLDSGTGQELLEKLRALPGKESLPFVFFSEERDAATVEAALDAGATDYLFKPLATQVLIAKLRRILEQTKAARRVRGVSGSLEEMAIPDIVQILHQGRKTGALQLESEGEKGAVFFKDGTVVDATWRGLRGEEAFYAVVRMTKGEFFVDPTVVPADRVIQASAEMLLLEGMRRMDEAGR